MKALPSSILPFVALCGLLAAGRGGGADTYPPKRKIMIGLNPSEKSENVQSNARWLAARISERAGLPIEIFVAQDYSGLVEAMRSQTIDFAFFAPVSFVFAENIAGARVLLKAERHGNPFYFGCIVVNADSAYRKIEDLRGKNIAWADPTSASGHIFPKAALIERGIDPDTFFGRQTFAGGHDAVLLAVINGTITCGATYANDTLGIDGYWPQLKAGELRSKIRPIFSSPPNPGDNLATSQYMIDNYGEIVKKVTEAVQHASDDSIGKTTMRQLYHVDAMVPAVSRDYDPVRRYAGLLGLGITGRIGKQDKGRLAEDARNRTYSWAAVIAAAMAGLGALAVQTLRDRRRRKPLPIPSAEVAMAGIAAVGTLPQTQYVLRNVSVVFGNDGGEQFTALKDISLDVRGGEFIAVIGLSGAGKSTLMRCLNRMNEPTSGTVVFGGEDVTHVQGRRLRMLRRQVGFVFQQFNLVKTLTALSNVLSGQLAHAVGWRTMLGMFPREDVAIAKRYLREVGLAEKMENRADKLSGGEQQRVAIARPLAQQPSVILADEPMASLDPKLSEVVLQILRRFNREQGITVIVNLHVLDLATRYADRIIALRRGEIVFDGRPEELSQAVIQEVYRSEP